MKINRFLGDTPAEGRQATDMSYAENLWLFFLLLFGIIVVPGMGHAVRAR